jgi:hypothetical protein
MPSFNLWRGVLLEYVPPQRSVEFSAQLARLFTQFGHEWEVETASPREKVDTEEDMARQAAIRVEISSAWSDVERSRRAMGVFSGERLAELESRILSE